MSRSDLPKFVPKESLPYLCKKPEDCKCEFDSDDSDSSGETDRRLVNWRRWLERRKELHEKLGESLQRDAGDLLMNAYEDIRCTKEEKLVFDYTNVKIADKYKGCPSFFKIPPSLPHPCNHRCPTEYITQLRKEDNCEIPEIAYTKVPDLVKFEKGVIPKSREGYWTWSYSEYRQEQFVKLADKIRIIEPHKPDLNKFILQAIPLKKPERKKKVQEHLKKNEVEEQEDESSDWDDRESNFLEKPLFIINYIPIYNTQNEDINAFLLYNYNILTKAVKRKKVKLENNTNMALKFRFFPYKKQRIFHNIKPDSVLYEQCFFYDKNEQIILPGEIKFFDFYFKCEFPRVCNEDFELKLKPNIFPNARILVHLMAIAEIEGLEEHCLTIKEKINNAVRKTAIDNFRSKPQDAKEAILFTYNKKQIFEAMNTTLDPYHHQIHYIYNKQVVDELEQFYEKIKMACHHPVWNLNIYDLRAMTKERELAEKEAFKVTVTEEYFREIEQDHTDEVNLCVPIVCADKAEKKPSKTNAKKVKSKEKAKGKGKDKETSKVELPTIKKKYERHERPQKYSDELESILAKLELSKLDPSLEQQKYDNVYMIIAVHFDRLCEEIENMKERLNLPIESFYPTLPSIKFESPRIEMEEKRDFYRDNLAKISLAPPKWQKQRPAFLEEIPLEDYIKRYKLYFGITDDEEGGGKKKKGKGKDKGKKDKGKKDKGKKGKDKKGKKGKQKDEGPKKETCDYLEPKLSHVIDKHKINQEFDPVYDTKPHKKIEDLKEIDVDVVGNLEEEEEAEEEEKPIITESMLQQYAYNLHLYFYTTIENIVISVYDYLDSLKVVVPPEQVNVMVACEDCGMHYKHKDINNVNFIDLRYILSTEDMTKPCGFKDEPPYKHKIKKVDEVDYITDVMDQEESLFSILRNYKSKPELVDPISYPKVTTRIVKPDLTAVQPTFEKVTETDDGVVDPFWSYYKDKCEQVDEKLMMSTQPLKKMYPPPPNIVEEAPKEDENKEEVEEKKKRKKHNKFPTEGLPDIKAQFCSADDQYYQDLSESFSSFDDDY